MPEQKNDLKDWCKIIKTDARDFLVQKFYDNDEEKECVIICTTSLCAFLKATMTFDTPEEADQAFDNITNETIDEYANNCFSFFFRTEQEIAIEED